jgi:predicted MFS family arabinose efflux permease
MFMVGVRPQQRGVKIKERPSAFMCVLRELMLGLRLVALAHEFQTSVAIVGQLAAATAITWGITTPLAGLIADVYGRRLKLLMGLLLMAVGILGSVLSHADLSCACQRHLVSPGRV